jgi:dTDP-4-dehydrorhamnose reductase
MILVTGGGGEFARYIKEFADVKVLNPRHNNLDIREWHAVREFFRIYYKKFDYVIHAAAISRPMKLHTESPESSIETKRKLYLYGRSS